MTVDKAIDKAAEDAKKLNLDIETNKVVEKVKDSTQELAKDIKHGTQENIKKVEKAAENIKKDLGDQAAKARDSVKDFLDKK